MRIRLTTFRCIFDQRLESGIDAGAAHREKNPLQHMCRLLRSGEPRISPLLASTEFGEGERIFYNFYPFKGLQLPVEDNAPERFLADEVELKIYGAIEERVSRNVELRTRPTATTRYAWRPCLINPTVEERVYLLGRTPTGGKVSKRYDHAEENCRQIALGKQLWRAGSDSANKAVHTCMSI
jgi:hypothetical protein